MLKIIKASNRRAIASLLTHTRTRSTATERRVAKIVGDVRRKGDIALTKYVRTLDCLEGPLEVTTEEVRDGASRVDPKVQKALRTATKHIKRVARKQLPRGWQTKVAPGITVEQRVLPLDRVGCYVPGGRFPLPSSLLMTVIPAQIAGVQEIIVACPRPEPIVLAAALEAGVTRLFRMGGAQAIAALAYGTETVPRVDKIVGPGGKFVSIAKSLVSDQTAIDMVAGPTELGIMADASSDPELVALDLISQAEHSKDTMCFVITQSKTMAKQIQKSIEKLIPGTERSSIIKESISKNGFIAVCKNENEMIGLANEIAPEHMELMVKNAKTLSKKITGAGLLLIGKNTPSSASDYLLGTNHILPTNGFGRTRGGLSVLDFLKLQTVIESKKSGLRKISKSLKVLTDAEDLPNHYKAVKRRLD